MKECCAGFAITTLKDVGEHHHVNCPNYKTEKFTYLMYYEEAIDAWTFAPKAVENLIDVDNQLEVGEEMELRFKRVEMTDEEYDALPEH